MSAKLQIDGGSYDIVVRNVVFTEDSGDILIELDGRISEAFYDSNKKDVLIGHPQCKSFYLDKVIEEKGELEMSITDKLKNLTKSSDTKLLEKYNIVDESGILIADGQKAFLQFLFDKSENRKDFIDTIKKLDSEEKK